MKSRIRHYRNSERNSEGDSRQPRKNSTPTAPNRGRSVKRMPPRPRKKQARAGMPLPFGPLRLERQRGHLQQAGPDRRKYPDQRESKTGGNNRALLPPILCPRAQPYPAARAGFVCPKPLARGFAKRGRYGIIRKTMRTFCGLRTKTGGRNVDDGEQADACRRSAGLL